MLSLNRIYYPWALYHWPEYDGYLVLIFVQHINHIKYDRSQNDIPKYGALGFSQVVFLKANMLSEMKILDK